MKRGFIFHSWKSLRCEKRAGSGARTGFVEIEFPTTCVKGTHKYRGEIHGYSYPPAGTGRAASVKALKTRC